MSDLLPVPMPGWLLVQQAELPEMTAGGVILPTVAREKAMVTPDGRCPFVLLVVATCPAQHSDFVPGDRVFPALSSMNNVPVFLDPLKQHMLGNDPRPDYFLVREADIAGKGTWTTSTPQHDGISEPTESVDAPAN